MNLPVPDAAFHWRAEPWGYALVCTPLQAITQHLFTTRPLQLRGATTEDGQLIAWTQAAASVGAGLDQVMRITQVHGRTIRVLRRGQTAPHDVEGRPEADAIVSNASELVLAVQVADCVPLLMADKRSGAAAAVHAGWRGTCARIAAAAVAAMASEFGTHPKDLHVAIGPSIGACCYEVGTELINAFGRAGASDQQLERWFKRTNDGSLRLDLWAVNFDQLVAAGVVSDRIYVSGLCTQTHADVFESYRADAAAAGRMAALIRVPHA